MLRAILNNAKAVRLIASHQLEGVRVPQVLRDDESEPLKRQEFGMLMGPALRRYEKEQREWNAKVATDARTGLHSIILHLGNDRTGEWISDTGNAPTEHHLTLLAWPAVRRVSNPRPPA
jgi:hypothetical protein